MAFNNFFTDLDKPATNEDFAGVFGTTAQTLSLSSNMASLSGEGASIVRWVRYSLGVPVITVELDNDQIFAAFETANIEYSAIVNRFNAKNWLSNLLGMNKNFLQSDYTGKLPHLTLDFLRRLGHPFAAAAGVGGLQSKRKAYITTVNNQTDYDLLNDFIDYESGSSVGEFIVSVGGSQIDVKNVWHNEPTSIYRLYDPYSSLNTLSNEFKYESFNMESTFQIMPIWADILRAGMLETHDRVRKSNYSYAMYGRDIRFLPPTGEGLKIWIEYSPGLDAFNPDYAPDGGDPSVSGITSIHDIPLKDIKYENINSMGKRWIRQYTLGLTMQYLGRIRRKFGSIPIPGNDIQLDGGEMVTEGTEICERLREELEKDLEETSLANMMKSDAELYEAIESQYQKIPIPTPIIFF